MDLQDQHIHLISSAHISEFFTFWMLIQEFNLVEHVEYDIVLKHSMDGHYTAASAYKAQFLGITLSLMDQMVRRFWPHVKPNYLLG